MTITQQIPGFPASGLRPAPGSGTLRSLAVSASISRISPATARGVTPPDARNSSATRRARAVAATSRWWLTSPSRPAEGPGNSSRAGSGWTVRTWAPGPGVRDTNRSRALNRPGAGSSVLMPDAAVIPIVAECYRDGPDDRATVGEGGQSRPASVVPGRQVSSLQEVPR